MSTEALAIYLLINMALGILLHASVRHSSSTQPKPMELVVYGLTFLVAGVPILAVTMLYATAKSLLQRHPLQHS